jgi:hypothetical protein
VLSCSNVGFEIEILDININATNVISTMSI